LAEQLVDGVGFMHSRGFVHLDLKPNNLVAITDVLKIIDFGLSRQIGDGTVLKGYRGTRSWVAPELGAEDVPEKGFYPIPADLWAVGVII
ncbi:Pkinase-domain-containing protein, partial [Atractiella rhizophila]